MSAPPGADAACAVIVGPPPRALLRRRVEIDLDVGLRKHDRADVAPLHDHPAALHRTRAGARRARADRRVPRDDRRGAIDLRRANRRRHVMAVDARLFPSRSNAAARASAATAVGVRAGPRRSRAPSTPPRGTSRPCPRDDTPAARATVRATVPLPAPDGPSMAMIKRARASLAVDYYSRDAARSEARDRRGGACDRRRPGWSHSRRTPARALSADLARHRDPVASSFCRCGRRPGLDARSAMVPTRHGAIAVRVYRPHRRRRTTARCCLSGRPRRRRGRTAARPVLRPARGDRRDGRLRAAPRACGSLGHAALHGSDRRCNASGWPIRSAPRAARPRRRSLASASRAAWRSSPRAGRRSRLGSRSSSRSAGTGICRAR